MADLFPAVNTDTNLKETLENWGTKLENLRNTCKVSTTPASTNLATGMIMFNSLGDFWAYNGSTWVLFS